jgi:hypothetical protein
LYNLNPKHDHLLEHHYCRNNTIAGTIHWGKTIPGHRGQSSEFVTLTQAVRDELEICNGSWYDVAQPSGNNVDVSVKVLLLV